MKYAAQAKYDKTNTRIVTLKLNIKTDEDIIRWLDKQPNKQGSIKCVVRDAISRGN